MAREMLDTSNSQTLVQESVISQTLAVETLVRTSQRMTHVKCQTLALDRH